MRTSGPTSSTASPRSPPICAMPGGSRTCRGEFAVRTPASLNRYAIVNRITAPRCPQVYRRHEPLADACANGARSASRRSGARLPDNEMASLIEPDGPDATGVICSPPTIARSSITIARISTRFRSEFWRTRLRGDRQALSHQPEPGEFAISMPRTVLLATAASLLFASASPAAAPQFDTPAKVAYLIDLSSGAVLYAKNADVRMPPASMAKMMTTDVAFELIKSGKLPLNKMCTVRPETWQKWHGPQAGSTMFLSPERAGQRRESAEGHRHACRATTRRSCSPNALPAPSRPSPTR